MAERIIMPKQGLQMTEGTVVEWLVQEGGEVVEGQPLFTIETDKLTITIDALVSGTLLKIVAAPGDTVPITALIGVVGKPGEDISSILLAEAGSAADGGTSGVTTAPMGGTLAAVSAAASPPRAPGERVFISPRAKTKAVERGLDWQSLRGSGPDGMIVERDVLAARVDTLGVKATPLAAKVASLVGVNLADVQGSGDRGKIVRADVERIRAARKAGKTGEKNLIPMRGMRKLIAERMKQSQNETPKPATAYRYAWTKLFD